MRTGGKGAAAIKITWNSLWRILPHAGSALLLRKLDTDYDPSDRVGAMNQLGDAGLCPGSMALEALNAPLR